LHYVYFFRKSRRSKIVTIPSFNTSPVYGKSRSQKIDELINKSSEAKTFESWLNVKIKMSYEKGDKETELILKSVKDKFKEFQIE